MINIYICDDNEITIEKGKSLFKKYSTNTQVDLQVRSFKRAEDMLFYMEDAYEIPHIIYLDIFMDELNGMETAKKLRNKNYEGEIIFLTTSPDYVFDAFDVRSFHYLVKQNIDEQRFYEILDEVIHKVYETDEDFFECTMGAELRRIPLADILYFEIFRRVVSVYYKNEKFEFYNTMEALEDQLKDKGFVRIHRSYLVNMKHIRMFKTNSLVVSNDKQIPIGKTYQKKVEEKFSSYNRKRWGN